MSHPKRLAPGVLRRRGRGCFSPVFTIAQRGRAALGYNKGMEYVLAQDEPLRDGAARVMAEGLAAAAAELRLPPDQRDHGVHECRKGLKMLRALVRLVRPGMEAEDFRRWNRGLRDTGRLLSPARDRAALAECADFLLQAAGEGEEREALALLREGLSGDGAVAADDGGTGEALPRLAEITAWLGTPLLRGKWKEEEVLFDGLRRSYRNGLAARREAEASGGGEAAHEWRKRAKDLRYQIMLLRGAWPEWCGAQEAELHRLTDALGRLHDCEALRAAAAGAAGAALLTAQRAAVLAAADRAMRGEWARARWCGARVYCGGPRGFARRLVAWRCGESG
jgi:CHAD domain-containing protein